MTISDGDIEEIAVRALRRARGDKWKAYEYAKSEISYSLSDTPQAFDSAERRLADALHI